MKIKHIGKILTAFIILVAMLMIRYIENRRPDPPALVIESSQEENAGKLIAVEVTGEVVNPGKYAVPFGSRIHDAVLRAGGITEDADIEKVNLSDFVSEDSSINVPKMHAHQTDVQSVSGSGAHKLCNINTATVQELADLPGIGVKLAQAIVDYRVTEGGFDSIEEIGNVDGIGEKKYESLKDKITVGGN